MLGGGEHDWSTLYLCMKIPQWNPLKTKKTKERGTRKSKGGWI
jgi:hypothetical protein